MQNADGVAGSNQDVIGGIEAGRRLSEGAGLFF
jgi:hypothetical protein